MAAAVGVQLSAGTDCRAVTRDGRRGDRMLQLITCSVSRGGAPMLQMKLALDSDWPADQCVLDHLQGGTSFEGDVANAMVRVLREGDIVVDIGANIGYLTVLASLLVGPTGRVIAFEPDPENVLRLRAN